ncbi:MAG: universal stress protein [Candidatus Bathyarchaeota archaeon]|nr:universal stress protein [Candidatus Bathyarchaeota archaeon]
MFKILVASDGSDPAKLALEYAAEMAVDKRGELVVLSVIQPLPTFITDDSSLGYYPELSDDLEGYYQTSLDTAVKWVNEKHPGLKVEGVLKRGRAAHEIIETSKQLKADMIVVGNRGTGGILSWMLGSVSRTVVESCTVPVLVVKDQKYCKAK